MKYKFFSLSAKNPEAGEIQLNTFCSSHRVSFIEKQFVQDGANSFWTICVSWLEGESAPTAMVENRNKLSSVDYKQILSEEDFAWYVELRNYNDQVWLASTKERFRY